MISAPRAAQRLIWAGHFGGFLGLDVAHTLNENVALTAKLFIAYCDTSCRFSLVHIANILADYGRNL
jgi:hypothetical protein